MSTAPRATGKATPKPMFQKADGTDADKSTTDTADKSTTDTADKATATTGETRFFDVEPSETTLDESDEVPEDEDADDPYAESREEYNRRLDTLELDHSDTGARVDALEQIVIGLCDTVLGKGVLPVLPNRETDVTQ